MIDKIINDVSLKKLTFQTGQTKWDGGSIIFAHSSVFPPLDPTLGKTQTTLPASSASSTSAPSSSTGGMTLEAVMAQLQCMDARLDKLSDELC